MKRIFWFLFMAACLLGGNAARAQPTAIPPNILAASNLPMVMLSASKDFTMFWKAYTDFDDIDLDGVVDRTYMPAFKYYGYFDPTKCYSYNASYDNGTVTGFSTVKGRFEPKRYADVESGKYYCTAGASEWSGNFLNWTAMSRIDILRKVLYGGMRSLDTATDTTLELSFVPRDSQALVKYYNGADLNRLTAFNSDDAKNKGLTFCRRPAENSGTSHSSTFTPEIRVAVGNVALWNMTEVRSCNWAATSTTPDTYYNGSTTVVQPTYTWKAATITYLGSNYVTPAGTYATGNHAHLASTPVQSSSNENTSFVARVQACVDGLIGTEKCWNYDSANSARRKPRGLLQEFGESRSSGVEPARAEFALMMGSYDHNLRGGVLRKNMGQINDEIDPTTGVFQAPTTGGGIIRSFNGITIYGYNVGTGLFSQTCYSNSIADGSCPSWGNPVGELLLESLRYYAGKTAAYSAGTKDVAVGLPAVTTQTDPLIDNPAIGSSTRTKLYGQPICRPLNMLTVTSGTSSFDDDDMGAMTDLGATSTAAADITKILGDKENITGTSRLIGQTGSPSTTDGLCTAKTVDDLGKVKGICADAPNFRGTYLGAGAAWWANTHDIRTIANKPTDLPKNALKVRTYGVSMSGGVATIAITLSSGKKVFITPAALDYLGFGSSGQIKRDPPLPANMVDFRVIQLSADGKTGAALVLWQHNMLGEDQDQDQLQSLRWVVDESTTPAKLTVYSQAVEADTGSVQWMASGYTVVGTDNDGVHFHSSINNYATKETGLIIPASTVQNADGSGCNKLCVLIDTLYTRGEVGKSYNIVGGTNALIREPLWFMSKYGGFKYLPGDTTKPLYQDLYPTDANPAPWDVKRADGKPCTGSDCSDGEPDNYFVARSPELLETSLREILEDIVNSSNTSPAIASSQLRSGDLKYVAKFDSGDGKGELSAFAINGTTGLFETKPAWEAHGKLTKTLSTSRQIITNDGTSGVAFEWATISDTKKTVLRSGSDDAYGKSMLAWLRGDTSDSTLFRKRAASSILGPIVNSNPTVEVPPNANYFGSDFDGYGAFVTDRLPRKSIVWVGAGDGMLHAFDAGPAVSGGGSPIMSYIPEPVFSRLPDWASASKPKVQSFVDGSPFTGDVKISSVWATYLFASLGRGGKGMFALDVTDPANLTEATASTIFKWQFTTADDANDLGYIISEPTVSRFSNQSGQIARMNNGKFAALFGNGVMSTSGKAVLYILFADGPSAGNWSGRYVKLVADIGTGNGLSQPIWVDENNDGIADTIYAGDLKGQLWKFDVSSADSANWKVAYAGKPLFTAKDSASNALPITSAPEFRFHPMGGVMLTFASGKSFETGDFPNTARTNTIFGIWDKPAFASVADADLDTTLPRGLTKLEARAFNNIDTSGLSRYVTGNPMDWTTKLGWYLPFNVSSEMSVSNIALANGQAIVVSVSPPPDKAKSTDPDPCFASPQARLSAVNAITGMPEGGLLGTVTVNNVTYSVGSIAISDQKVRVSKDAIGIGSGGKCANGQLDCTRIVGEKTDKGLTSNNNNARIFWREIPGLKTK